MKIDIRDVRGILAHGWGRRTPIIHALANEVLRLRREASRRLKPVIVTIRADGDVDVYAASGVDVSLVHWPRVPKEDYDLAERWVASKLPKHHRWMFDNQSFRKVARGSHKLCRTPKELLRGMVREALLAEINGLEAVIRELRSA